MADSPDATIRSALRYLSAGVGLDGVSTSMLVGLSRNIERLLRERLPAQTVNVGDIFVDLHALEEREVVEIIVKTDKTPLVSYKVVSSADPRRAGGAGKCSLPLFKTQHFSRNQ